MATAWEYFLGSVAISCFHPYTPTAYATIY